MNAQDHVDVNADADKVTKAKPRRKTSVKAPAESGKRSLNLRIDEDTYERLHIHALRRRVTVSELVMSLASENLREWHLSRTPTRAGESE